MNVRFVIRLWMVPILLGTCAFAALAQDSVVDPYRQILQRQFGTASEAMEAIAAEIQAAGPEKRPGIEARLIAVRRFAGGHAGRQTVCLRDALPSRQREVHPVGR